jgi:hypothetical protein
MIYTTVVNKVIHNLFSTDLASVLPPIFIPGFEQG